VAGGFGVRLVGRITCAVVARGWVVGCRFIFVDLSGQEFWNQV
jgi:hypothetical protein